jgi:hypothetical protein
VCSVATVTLPYLGYVEKLLTKLWMAVEDKNCITQHRVESPPPLSSSYTIEHPIKSEAISEHKSRFLKFVAHLASGS